MAAPEFWYDGQEYVYRDEFGVDHFTGTADIDDAEAAVRLDISPDDES